MNILSKKRDSGFSINLIYEKRDTTINALIRANVERNVRPFVGRQLAAEDLVIDIKWHLLESLTSPNLDVI